MHSTLEAIAVRSGQLCATLAIALVFLTTLVVFLRYGFSIGATELQELMSYLFAAICLLSSGYTLQSDGHVRVDVFYRGMSERSKAWVNAMGFIVFLMPFCLFIIFVSWGFVLDSWRIWEGSGNANGIDAVYLLKSLIPLTALSLLLQGSAGFIRNVRELVLP